MITRLYLDQCFRHFDRTFRFERGLTGVVGPNESGKSLIVETVRYALFGARALRGKAEDYKRLHVELDFEIAGTAYTVIRKPNRVELVGIASGTRPVNEAIRRVLGYDLAVFDVANACNQGNIEALSDMRPTERKAMVDRTVGLDMLDALIRHCGTEASALRREAEAMRRTLAAPVAPDVPEGYVASADLQRNLADARIKARRHAELIGMFRSAPPKVASDLRVTEAETRVLELKALHQEWQELRGYLSRAVAEPALPGPCPVGVPENELVAHEEARRDTLDRRRALEAELRKLEPEPHPAIDLDAFEASHDAADLWDRKRKLLDQGSLTCPECSHRWPVAADQLATYANIEETLRPSITRRQIADCRKLIGNRDRIAALRATLDGLESPVDRSADLARARAHAAAVEAYERARSAWQVYNQDLPIKQARLAEVAGVADLLVAAEDALATARHADWWRRMAPLEAEMATLARAEDQARHLQAALQVSLDHESRLAEFEKTQVAFDRITLDIAEVESKSAEYATARERITDLKVSLKSHLLPALNRVASLLLAQMTGGARSRIEVDDAFEILVDGQALATLSGSGKAVANLAIRIALGQILTNRVFSVFMADEVDAAMDEDRAEYTAQALRRLTSMVAQVILVTHKRPQTDVTMELGRG